MKEKPQLVENENIKETLIINNDVIEIEKTSIVVAFYPLVKGDFHKLTSSDNYEIWLNNFIVALLTSIFNFIAKILAFHYWPAKNTAKPEGWEITLIAITLIGTIICLILKNLCSSSKKKLKNRIETRLGK